MLRQLFDEPRRKDEGLLLEASQAIVRFSDRLHKYNEANIDSSPKFKRIELWTRGLLLSLNDLEQSYYCASRYAERIHKTSLTDMSQEERDDYYRHVYFYKNGFIRLFALFDKLGYFLNDLLELHTEREKPHFSYFTVLRQMRKQNIQPQLEKKLYNYKVEYATPMKKLKEQRNTEIHYMNAEMQDDLMRIYYEHNPKDPLENLQQNMADLDKGLKLSMLCLLTVFEASYEKIDK
jgi:hypothetical protein